MLSLYEILKASKTGIAPDMWTALAGANFGGAGSGAEVKELTGIPPLSFTADGTPLLDYLISGNLSQTGTPTPQNPIQPQECGERTGNLFDENYPNIKVDRLTYRSIYVGDGTFTLSTTTAQFKSTATLFLLAGNVGIGASTQGNGVWNGNPRTVTAVDGYVTIAYRYYENGETSDPRSNDVMLNTGSQPLPYEPFGIKIPISSANTTTPIYLGEVETTRRIKKLVLTGKETWYLYSTNVVHQFYTQGMVIGGVAFSSAYSTITPYGMTANNINGDYGCYTVASGNEIAFQMYGSRVDIPSQTEWKSYLAAQYAAGTPVTVWYVLATPTTGTVNEPLRKIGDYADTVSMEQARVQIPTNRGNTVIDVETTLKPSQMYIKYQE